MKILTLFAPGKMAGAEKVVSVGHNALQTRFSSADIFETAPLLCLIKEENYPHYAMDFNQHIINKDQTHFLNSNHFLDIKLITQFKHFIKKNDIKIIHTHGYKALFYAFMVKIISLNKFAIVHTHHGNTGHTLQVRIYEKIAFFLMKYCHRVVSLSPVMSKTLNQEGIKNTKEIANMFSLQGESNEVDHREAEFNLLYLGRFSIEKNPETLLHSFSLFLKDYPDATLHMLGDGPLLNECRQKYKNYKNIIFHGYQSNVTNFIQNASYLCLPSLSEGMPMTVIEALCLGTPIIANKVGALEYMCNENNSILIDIDSYKKDSKNQELDKDALNQKWLEVLNLSTRSELKEYTMCKRFEEQEKYSTATWSALTDSLYQEVAQGLLK